MIEKGFCQIKDHKGKQIIGICENTNCIQPNRKVCLKCIQVHEKYDSNFQSDDIKDEIDIDIILDQFKQANIGILVNIQLQCQIQQYLLHLELINLIKTKTFKLDYLSDILNQLDSFKTNIWSNISSSDYLLNNDNRGIDNYQQKLYNKIIQLNDQKDFYLINFVMYQYSNLDTQYNNNNSFEENNLQQILQSFQNQKDQIFDSLIKNETFIQKQRSNDPIITLCEIVLDQGQQLDINDMFLQFEKFKHLLFQRIDFKALYIDSYAKVFNQDYEKYFTDALNLVEQSINLNPEYSKSLYLNCVLLIEQKQFDSALNLFEQVIGMDNLFVDAYNQKGYCLYCLQRYSESIDAYNQAIKLDPNNEIYYYNKGNSFHNLTRYQEAIEMYNQAIQLNPYDDIYYFDQGNSLFCLGRYYEALNMYDQANKFNPYNDDYYFSKGKSYHKLQNYEKAITMFDQAIQIQPNLDEYYYHKGDSLFELKKYQKALNIIEVNI